jgi:hypothetical protein
MTNREQLNKNHRNWYAYNEFDRTSINNDIIKYAEYLKTII